MNFYDTINNVKSDAGKTCYRESGATAPSTFVIAAVSSERSSEP